MSDSAENAEPTEDELTDEVMDILDADVLTDDRKMKILLYFLGTLTGIHDNLDKLRTSAPEDHNPRDPFDHNVEQAQIALEHASFRIHQIATHVRKHMDEREQSNDE